MEISKKIITFENIKSKKYYFFEKVIKRSIIFYQIEFPSPIKNIQDIIKYENKEYIGSQKLFFTYASHILKDFEISPLINEDLKYTNILFEAEEEKEKSILFNSFVDYFINKEEDLKTKFFNRLFKDKKIFAQEIKDRKNILVLAKIVNNNILNKSFKNLFNNYKDQIKKFSIIDEIKNQINDFYKEIKDAIKRRKRHRNMSILIKKF